MPIPVIFAQAEADGGKEAALTRRAIEAGICPEGYAHRRGALPVTGAGDGPASGFGIGAPFDSLVPGTVLAGLADQASGADRAFTDVNDDQLLGLMGARQRQEAWSAWELLTTVAEFMRRRPAPGCGFDLPGRMPQVWNEHAASELAAQLRLTPGAADEMLGLAHDLAVKLPATSAALRDGIIDAGKARIIAWHCSLLTPDEARAAEAILFANPEVDEMTWGMVPDRIARAVIEVNPEAATRRREQAARQRRVEVLREDSGNTMIAGRELPPAAALAASANLIARARQLRKAGIDGGMDELRVLAYLEKLGVMNPLENSQAGTGPDGSQGGDGKDGETDDGNGGGGDGGPSPAGPGNPGGGAGAVPGAVPAGFAGRVNMTLPLVTLLGLAERPGTMSRAGAIDPTLVRDLAVAAARNPPACARPGPSAGTTTGTSKHPTGAWNRPDPAAGFRWTTPSGRSYLSRPTQYPD